jgi:hypothetical protein
MQGGMPRHAAKLLSPLSIGQREYIETNRSLYTEYAIESQAFIE